jgi:hypothetical protein
MAGFLDPFAKSIEAEYTRYLADDILGKIIFKNFALNVLGVKPNDVSVTLSRHGDTGTRRDSSDAGVRFQDRSYIVEAKISRWLVQKRNKISPINRWQFSKLKRSQSGTVRNKYDLVFAVGIDAPGLENPWGFWQHYDTQMRSAKIAGEPCGLSQWPHTPEFLKHCGIFILPRDLVLLADFPNSLYVTVRSVATHRCSDFFAWGSDIPRLKSVWHRAVDTLKRV